MSLEIPTLMLCAGAAAGLAILGAGASACAVVLPNDPTNIHGIGTLDGMAGAILDGGMRPGIAKDIFSPKALGKRIGANAFVSIGMSNAERMSQLGGRSSVYGMAGGVSVIGAGVSESRSIDDQAIWVRTAGWYPGLGFSDLGGESWSIVW